MERSYPATAHSGKRGAYLVRGPETGDVMTGSLKTAYGRDKSLPDDMASLLAMLNRIPD